MKTRTIIIAYWFLSNRTSSRKFHSILTPPRCGVKVTGLGVSFWFTEKKETLSLYCYSQLERTGFWLGSRQKCFFVWPMLCSFFFLFLAHVPTGSLQMAPFIVHKSTQTLWFSETRVCFVSVYMRLKAGEQTVQKRGCLTLLYTLALLTPWRVAPSVVRWTVAATDARKYALIHLWAQHLKNLVAELSWNWSNSLEV